MPCVPGTRPRSVGARRSSPSDRGLSPSRKNAWVCRVARRGTASGVPGRGDRDEGLEDVERRCVVGRGRARAVDRVARLAGELGDELLDALDGAGLEQEPADRLHPDEVEVVTSEEALDARA